MLDETRVEDPWYQIASFIERERTRKGLSRQQLADLVGVSRATIFNWENGRRIPVEKCATLAGGLGIPSDQLLKLHPEVLAAAPASTEALPSTSEGLRLTRREVLFVGLGIAALVVGIGFAAWSTASTDCFAVGVGFPSSSATFRQVFDDAGGRTQLGCATDEIHKFGPGIIQHLEGGALGDGAILSLDRQEAFVLAGEAYDTYRWIADGASADVAGYPIDQPRECAGTVIIPLAGGVAGRGALMESQDGSTYVWVAGGVWPTYLRTGGPTGPLGPPVRTEWDDAGFTTVFAGGTIMSMHGRVPEISGADSGGPAFDVTNCPYVSVQVAATLSN